MGTGGGVFSCNELALMSLFQSGEPVTVNAIDRVVRSLVAAYITKGEAQRFFGEMQRYVREIECTSAGVEFHNIEGQDQICDWTIFENEEGKIVEMNDERGILKKYVALEPTREQQESRLRAVEKGVVRLAIHHAFRMSGKMVQRHADTVFSLVESAVAGKRWGLVYLVAADRTTPDEDTKPYFWLEEREEAIHISVPFLVILGDYVSHIEEARVEALVQQLLQYEEHKAALSKRRLEVACKEARETTQTEIARRGELFLLDNFVASIGEISAMPIVQTAVSTVRRILRGELPEEPEAPPVPRLDLRRIQRAPTMPQREEAVLVQRILRELRGSYEDGAMYADIIEQTFTGAGLKMPATREELFRQTYIDEETDFLIKTQLRKCEERVCSSSPAGPAAYIGFHVGDLGAPPAKVQAGAAADEFATMDDALRAMRRRNGLGRGGVSQERRGLGEEGELSRRQLVTVGGGDGEEQMGDDFRELMGIGDASTTDRMVSDAAQPARCVEGADGSSSAPHSLLFVREGIEEHDQGSKRRGRRRGAVDSSMGGEAADAAEDGGTGADDTMPPNQQEHILLLLSCLGDLLDSEDARLRQCAIRHLLFLQAGASQDGREETIITRMLEGVSEEEKTRAMQEHEEATIWELVEQISAHSETIRDTTKGLDEHLQAYRELERIYCALVMPSPDEQGEEEMIAETAILVENMLRQFQEEYRRLGALSDCASRALRGDKLLEQFLDAYHPFNIDDELLKAEVMKKVGPGKKALMDVVLAAMGEAVEKMVPTGELRYTTVRLKPRKEPISQAHVWTEELSVESERWTLTQAGTWSKVDEATLRKRTKVVLRITTAMLAVLIEWADKNVGKIKDLCHAIIEYERARRERGLSHENAMGEDTSGYLQSLEEMIDRCEGRLRSVVLRGGQGSRLRGRGVVVKMPWREGTPAHGSSGGSLHSMLLPPPLGLTGSETVPRILQLAHVTEKVFLKPVQLFEQLQAQVHSRYGMYASAEQKLRAALREDEGAEPTLRVIPNTEVAIGVVYNPWGHVWYTTERDLMLMQMLDAITGQGPQNFFQYVNVRVAIHQPIPEFFPSMLEAHQIAMHTAVLHASNPVFGENMVRLYTAMDAFTRACEQHPAAPPYDEAREVLHAMIEGDIGIDGLYCGDELVQQRLNAALRGRVFREYVITDTELGIPGAEERMAGLGIDPATNSIDNTTMILRVDGAEVLSAENLWHIEQQVAAARDHGGELRYIVGQRTIDALRSTRLDGARREILLRLIRQGSVSVGAYCKGTGLLVSFPEAVVNTKMISNMDTVLGEAYSQHNRGERVELYIRLQLLLMVYFRQILAPGRRVVIQNAIQSQRQLSQSHRKDLESYTKDVQESFGLELTDEALTVLCGYGSPHQIFGLTISSSEETIRACRHNISDLRQYIVIDSLGFPIVCLQLGDDGYAVFAGASSETMQDKDIRIPPFVEVEEDGIDRVVSHLMQCVYAVWNVAHRVLGTAAVAPHLSPVADETALPIPEVEVRHTAMRHLAAAA